MNNDNQKNMEENMPNFVVITVPADALAPAGARASAGIVMTKLGSHMYTVLAHKELTHWAEQKYEQFADNIFNSFLIEYGDVLFEISLKFHPDDPIIDKKSIAVFT